MQLELLASVIVWWIEIVFLAARRRRRRKDGAQSNPKLLPSHSILIMLHLKAFHSTLYNNTCTRYYNLLFSLPFKWPLREEGGSTSVGKKEMISFNFHAHRPWGGKETSSSILEVLNWERLAIWPSVSLSLSSSFISAPSSRWPFYVCGKQVKVNTTVQPVLVYYWLAIGM